MNDKQDSKIVNIQAYKQDGTLYRQWNGAKIISENDKEIIALLYRTRVAELSGQKWAVLEPMLWFFFKDEFYNVSVQIKKNKCYFYANIASPLLKEEGAIKFIDYDLDVKKYPDVKVKVMDRTEYQLHKKIYNYSMELINKIDGTLIELLEKAEKDIYPFAPNEIQAIVNKLVDENAYPKKHLLKNTKPA